MARYRDLDKINPLYATSVVGAVRMFFLETLPEEDVAPVVHAHWIDTWGHSLFECSACGNEFDDRLMLLDHQNDFPNYCPVCGAKMDEEVGNGK